MGEVFKLRQKHTIEPSFVMDKTFLLFPNVSHQKCTTFIR